MGNYDHEERMTVATFLSDPNAKKHFSKMDYGLKNGLHFQLWQDQEDTFRFIEKHYKELRQYYLDFFQVILDASGEATQKYYFFDFLPGSRGSIPPENRHFLPNEFVIVGFMLYKIIYLDGYIELNTLPALQKKIRQDYEDIKPGIYRALAKAKRLNTTQMDDAKVDDVIEKALREFSRIGWIDWDGDLFDILPSFQRLPKIYGDYINNPDSWLDNDPSL